MGLKQMLKKSQAALYMILVQVFMTGILLLSKIILNRGAFVFSLLTYRLIVATVFLIPLALVMERDMVKKLSWMALLWIFLNGLFGITLTLGLYYSGLRLTTATFASNFLNLVPINTFVFSTVSGLEKLGLRTKGGRVKLAGTILCVAGAVTITVYRGKPLWSSHGQDHQASMQKSSKEMVRGSFMLLGSCLSTATWFIVQVKLFKVFPSMYWATMLTCVAGCVQATVVGVALDRGKAAWSLAWDLNLLTIVYSGILTTGVSFILISWTVAHRGPTYPSMFNPLSLIFVAILESLVMGEVLYVGSILGTILIIIGLYAFLWGKKSQLRASNTNQDDVSMEPIEARSSVSITPVSVGDVTMVLDSNQTSSIIVPVAADHPNIDKLEKDIEIAN